MNKEEFTSRILGMEAELYHVSKSILRDDFDCADATQNAILAAYSKLGTLKKEKYFKTWMIRILINECYQILRSQNRQSIHEEEMDAGNGIQSEAIASGNTEEFQPEYVIEREWIREALYSLEESYRIPIVLYYVDGYTIQEIQQILGIKRGAVYTRLSRGRKLLQERLKEAL